MKIYRVNEPVEERPDEDLPLEKAQEIIGGWVEAIALRHGLLALMDEEGIPKQLPFNPEATNEVDKLTAPDILHRLYGTVIILRQKDFGYDE